MKLAITCGLPLSGKSTRAKILQETEGYTIVCPDTIRLALHGNQFIGLAEPFVWAIAQTMVRTLLMSGHNVVVDATNTTKERRKMWVNMAKEFGLNLNIYYLTAPVYTCKERNSKIHRLDNAIIERMNKQFEPPEPKEGKFILEVS